MTLEQSLLEVVRSAAERAQHECFYCGRSSDCFEEIDQELVCTQTGSVIWLDEFDEIARFVVRDVVHALGLDGSVLYKP